MRCQENLPFRRSWNEESRNFEEIYMELAVSLVFVGLGILFVAFIFIKSFIDNKKEKAVMTEIFQKYGYY